MVTLNSYNLDTKVFILAIIIYIISQIFKEVDIYLIIR